MTRSTNLRTGSSSSTTRTLMERLELAMGDHLDEDVAQNRAETCESAHAFSPRRLNYRCVCAAPTPGPDSARPACAPVCWPFFTVTMPLTMTVLMPAGNWCGLS